MRVLDNFDFELDSNTVFAHLRLDPSGPYAGEVLSLFAAARERARPRALYAVASHSAEGDDTVVLTAEDEGFQPGLQGRFKTRVLRRQLNGVKRVFPYIASCGPELDSIPIAAGDLFGRFCLDAIKELALYAAVAHLSNHLQSTYGIEHLASMNPGSGDRDVWPLEQQKDLFAFLAGGPESIGVSLTESCLMIPNKTVSGLLFPCTDDFHSCQLCQREPCSHRRADFDPHLSETLRRA